MTDACKDEIKFWLLKSMEGWKWGVCFLLIRRWYFDDDRDFFHSPALI